MRTYFWGALLIATFVYAQSCPSGYVPSGNSLQCCQSYYDPDGFCSNSVDPTIVHCHVPPSFGIYYGLPTRISSISNVMVVGAPGGNRIITNPTTGLNEVAFFGGEGVSVMVSSLEVPADGVLELVTQGNGGDGMGTAGAQGGDALERNSAYFGAAGGGGGSFITAYSSQELLIAAGAGGGAGTQGAGGSAGTSAGSNGATSAIGNSQGGQGAQGAFAGGGNANAQYNGIKYYGGQGDHGGGGGGGGYYGGAGVNGASGIGGGGGGGDSFFPAGGIGVPSTAGCSISFDFPANCVLVPSLRARSRKRKQRFELDW